MNTPAPYSPFPAQQASMELFELGLNVFPLPYGRKHGYDWKNLQFTRLDRNAPRHGLKDMTQDQCNLAVTVGRDSHNLFVLDYETHEGFREAVAELQKRNIPVWAVSTTRGGHLWLRCTEGVVKSVRRDDMELRGSSGYVLAPPSVNESSGVVYEWLLREGETIPTVTLDQLDFLPFSVRLEHPPRHPPSTHTRHLNRPTLDYLRHGHNYQQGCRHVSFFSACCDYVEKGFSRAEIDRDLVPVAKRSGLGDDGDSAVFARIPEWAVTRIKPRGQPPERTFAWQRALAFLNNHQWKGKQGSTDYAVAAALIERARKFTRADGSFRASYRELQQWARIGNRQTLAKSLKRLQQASFIRYAGRDELSTASLWRFGQAVMQTEPFRENTGGISGDYPCNISSGSVLLPLSDALERGALGVTGWRLYRALLDSGIALSRRDLVAASGLSEGQVAYALRPDGWLRKAGLVRRTAAGWCAIAATAAELDAKVAAPAGKLGRAARRAALHRKERAIYAGKILSQSRRNWNRRECSRQQGWGIGQAAL